MNTEVSVTGGLTGYQGVFSETKWMSDFDHDIWETTPAFETSNIRAGLD